MKTENIKNMLILFFIYCAGVVFGTALFVTLFRLNIFNELDYVFYRAIVLLLLSCATMAAALFIIKINTRLKYIITYRDLVIFVLILFSLNFNFYIMIPFNVSRSNSVLLIGYLEKNDGVPKTEDDITKFMIEKYFGEYKAVSLRLKEQMALGNIQATKNGYIVTESGKKYMEILKKISDIYKVKNNFLDIKK